MQGPTLLKCTTHRGRGVSKNRDSIQVSLRSGEQVSSSPTVPHTAAAWTAALQKTVGVPHALQAAHHLLEHA